MSTELVKCFDSQAIIAPGTTSKLSVAILLALHVMIRGNETANKLARIGDEWWAPGPVIDTTRSYVKENVNKCVLSETMAY